MASGQSSSAKPPGDKAASSAASGPSVASSATSSSPASSRCPVDFKLEIYGNVGNLPGLHFACVAEADAAFAALADWLSLSLHGYQEERDEK